MYYGNYALGIHYAWILQIFQLTTHKILRQNMNNFEFEHEGKKTLGIHAHLHVIF